MKHTNQSANSMNGSFPTDLQRAVSTFTRAPLPNQQNRAKSTKTTTKTTTESATSYAGLHHSSSSVNSTTSKQPSPSYSDCYNGTLSLLDDNALEHLDSVHGGGVVHDSQVFEESQESVSSLKAPVDEVCVKSNKNLLTVDAAQIKAVLDKRTEETNINSSGYKDSQDTNMEATQTSVETSRKHMSPSSLKWFDAIQQERDMSKPTLRQQCPKVWDLVGSYIKCWNEEEWEGPNVNVNPTDFKKRVAKHILDTRVKILRSEVPCQHLLPKTTGSLVFFYSQMTFEEFAERSYKKDLVKIAKTLEIKPNDIIRFFGIALMGTNRDSLISLGVGKAMTRAELDGDLSQIDSIMRDWTKQFHNYSVILSDPKRAVHLDSYCDLEPNDHTRIELHREWKFFKNLFFSVLSKYNISMKKWTKGTGGGPGEDENYANWMERNDEKFVNYCGPKDADVLAWIYMLDKKEGFPLNVRNNPPPKDTVMEDGTSNKSTSSHKKQKKQTRSMQAMETFQSHMEKTMDKTFGALTEFTSAYKGNLSSKVTGRLEAFQLIEVCESKLKVLKEEEANDTSTDITRAMKIESIQNVLNETYKNLPK